MTMSKNWSKILITAFLCLSVNVVADAQSGAYTGYTPYSVFGIGDLSSSGNAYNNSMGGVGIASRNRKYINYLNPAAVTAKDSLSFMADISLYQHNRIYTQGDAKNVTNSANINNIAFSFPVYRSSAVMFGIAPYSSTGYGFSSVVTDPEIIGHTGNIYTSASGQGSIYQLFAAAGATFWNSLSVGAEYIFYFGNINKTSNVTFSDSSYGGINSGFDLDMHAGTVKLGLQYEKPVGNKTICVGATYSFDTKVRGYITDFAYNTGAIVDTLRHNVDTLSHSGKVKFAGELGLGISIRSGQRWMAEFDYTRSDWSDSGMEEVIGLSSVSNRRFSSTVASSYRLGFEYTPNVNDIRYYHRRCTYRLGAYRENLYYKLDGHQISSTGLTLGATLPVFRLYNGLSVAVDLGQKGSVQHDLIRERYVRFTVGFNIHDLWFQKHRYK